MAVAWERGNFNTVATADGAVLEYLGKAFQDGVNPAAYAKRDHIASGRIPAIPEGDFHRV